MAVDTKPITVVETAPHIRFADKHMTARERSDVIDFIARNPEAGVVIRGTGGLRKHRHAAKGRGKNGGVRVIYYYHDQAMPVFLCTG